VITVHTGYRTPVNGCMAQTGDDGLCPYVATHAVTIRTDDGPVHSAVCGVHELVLRDEGRLAGSKPIGSER